MLLLIWFGHFVEYIQERNKNCVHLEAFPDGFYMTVRIYSAGYLWGICEKGSMPMYRNRDYPVGLKLHFA